MSVSSLDTNPDQLRCVLDSVVNPSNTVDPRLRFDIEKWTSIHSGRSEVTEPCRQIMLQTVPSGRVERTSSPQLYKERGISGAQTKTMVRETSLLL